MFAQSWHIQTHRPLSRLYVADASMQIACRTLQWIPSVGCTATIVRVNMWVLLRLCGNACSYYAQKHMWSFSFSRYVGSCACVLFRGRVELVKCGWAENSKHLSTQGMIMYVSHVLKPLCVLCMQANVQGSQDEQSPQGLRVMWESSVPRCSSLL